MKWILLVWIFVTLVLIGLIAKIFPTIKKLARLVKMAKQNQDHPAPQTVFGATPIYLPQIEKDFAGFHNNEAIAAITTALYEYLAIKYEGAANFTKGNVSPGLIAMVDRQTGHTVHNETVRHIAITRYKKTKEYATITYQASVGYLLDDQQKEERYVIEYTLRLREHGIEKKALICTQCGGTYDSTSQTQCPFCGAAIVRDTIMSWQITSMKIG